MLILPSLIKLDEKEKNFRSISAGITAIVIILILLLCFFWRASRPDYISIGEHELEMIAGVGEGDGNGVSTDFGDNREGSQKVNNKLPATADPIADMPALPKVSTPTQVPTAPPPAPIPPKTSTSSDKTDLVGNDADSPIAAADKPKDKKDDKKNPPKDTKTTTTTSTTKTTAATTDNKGKTTTTTSTTTTTTNSQNSGKTSTTTTPSGGGSNHGNNSNGSVGNSGSPQVNVLNIDGMEWGDGNGKGGNGGLNNRVAIKVFKPKYDVQEEGKVVFEFYIAPDGNVVNCKALPNRFPSLAKIGMETISQWKFNKINPASPNQKVVVTFTFKLNG